MEAAAPGRGAGSAGDDPVVQRILTRLSSEVGDERYARYFQDQARLGLHEGRLDVTVPTGFVADLLGRRFGDSLRRVAAVELGRPEGSTVEVKFRVDRSAFSGPAPLAAPSPTPGGGLRPDPSRRAPTALRFRLEDFIVGEANRLAYSAAERLVEPDCPKTFSPLFVHGLCGLGKTHLLQGIAGRFRERRPGARVRYTTAEAFTNDYVSAVRSGKLETFRAAYRGLDLLCIDDVQFLANKTSTQGELLHTFDAVDLGGARVALASDEHPRQIGRLSAGLVSRFLAGMVVRLDPPDAALRERIVRALGERRGLRLEPAAAACLAEAVARGTSGTASIRDLEGAVTRVEALVRLLPEAPDSGAPIGATLVHRALGVGAPGPDGISDAGHRARRPIRVERICDEVCRTLRVDGPEMMGRGRHKRVVLARSLVAHLARSMTTLSFPEIARAMGRPNHSTVVTACQRIRAQIEREESPDLGPDAGPELAGLTLRGLAEQIRQGIVRTA